MEFPTQLRNILQSRKGWRWIIIDFLIAFFSIWLAQKLSPHGDVYEPYKRILVSITYAMLMVITVRLCGLNTHRVEHLFTRYEIILASIQGSLIAFFIVDMAITFVYLHHFGRYVIGITLILSVSGIALIRIVYQWYLKKNPINVAFMCRKELTVELTERFKSDPHFNVVCVGSEEPLKHDDHETGFKNIVIADPDQFVQVLKNNNTDFAISVYDGRMSPIISRVIKRLPFAGIDVLNLGAFIELFHREIPLSYRNLHWHTADFFLPKHSATVIIKRLIDFIAALLGIIFLLPLFPIVMLLIKLDSSGPAFYSQIRTGLMGKPFNIYKFRTMRQDAESSGAQWAQKEDPRITRMGSFLRKTRIDEIPQLWNVLKGDMSLVGPRPERPEFIEDLKKVIPLYEWRSLVPPGLTGWAQIRHGYTDTTEGIRRKLQYDLYYIKNHSIWLDLEIMLRTIPMIMKGSR
jgi:exopolysaccharide biosynthesis polyprenyl glycosylphosphotransferase